MEKNHTRDASNQTEDENNEQIIIDFPEDLLSEPALWPECCIYRVPRKLRAINPAAYTPQLISIGPLHHKDEALKPMEKQKLRYLAEFCCRTEMNLNELANKIKELEGKIRHCYEETFDEVSSDTFVKMILLDSVFIIELFLRRAEKNNLITNRETMHGYEDDFILGQSTREDGLFWDLILVENQLPYFVLDDLYEFSIRLPSTEVFPSFYSLMRYNLLEYLFLVDPFSPSETKESKNQCTYVSRLFCFGITRRFTSHWHKDGGGEEEDEYEEEDHPVTPLHFTDYGRTHRSRGDQMGDYHYSVTNLYNATVLHEVGVKFKATARLSPIDIKFERGELKMRTFLAADNTARLIRNLMAFEQCHYPNEPLICDYVLILDFLINTEKDVDLLVQNGIIVNQLGDNKRVAKLVNKLRLEITANGSSLYDLSVRLNEYCDDSMRRRVSTLKNVYFSNMWRGTGTIAAIALLVFTFTQFLDSIKII